MSAPAFDVGTLSWVKDEIDLALERAGEALARHAADTGDAGEARALIEARGHLHQAGGALVLVGLAGASHCVDTLEAVLARLAQRGEAVAALDGVAIGAAAGSLILALRRYLDELMAGHPDQPLRLWPACRALHLASAGAVDDAAALALFTPDPALRPPRRAASGSLTPPRLKALRMGFARGLAKRAGGDARGLVDMHNALAILEAGLDDAAARALWWVALGWFETLAAVPAAGAAGESEARLLADLDGQFAAVAAGDARPAGDALLKGMLYAIALAPAGGSQLESVRAAYRLADLIPSADAVVATRRAACRAPLTAAMGEWERLSQGQASALMRFHEVAQLLAATAHASGDAVLADIADALAAFAAGQRRQPEQVASAAIDEGAAAMVLIETAIDSEGARSPRDEAMFVAATGQQIARLAAVQQTPSRSLPAAPPQAWRMRQVEAQLAVELGNALETLEALLTPLFQSAAAPPADATVAARAALQRIAGAFQFVDAPQAVAMATAAHAQLADPAQFPAIAARLAALARFAAALAHGQVDHSVLADWAVDQGAAIETAACAEHSPERAATAPVAASADAEMLAIFLAEATEVLATLAVAQPLLRAQPADRASLTTVRRAFHTLKGSGRMVGLEALADAAYAVERLLNQRLDAHAGAAGELLALLETARSLFADWLAALGAGQPPPSGAALIARCRALLDAVAPASDSATASGAAAAVPPAPTFAPLDAVAPPLAAPTEAVVAVGNLRLSPTLFQLYVDEAGGHVATLRNALSADAGSPSRELIRAAHTLAGISAGTGFGSVQALAHALEDALVRHSLAHAVPTESGRLLFARVAGALQGMVGAIAERRAPPAEAGLAAALAALEPPAPPVPPVPGAAATPAAQAEAAVSPLAERRRMRPADEIDGQLAMLFLEEADEALRQLDTDLRAWRTAPTDDGARGRRLARVLHTFKGGARMCGAMGLGELAHSMETRVEQMLAQGVDATTLDSLDASLQRAQLLVDGIREKAAGGPATPSAATAAAVTTAMPAAQAVAPAPDTAAVLRVRAELIDRLVNQTGEMAIARGRIDGSVKASKAALLDLADSVTRLKGQLREFELHAESSMQSQLGRGAHEAYRREFDPLELDRFTRLQELTRMMVESVGDVATLQHTLLRQSEAAGEALVLQSRQQRELAHALLRARMVPFATVAERLHRVVRQTARELGRQANLDIRGGEAPVDRSVLERMVGPLEHLLRNAVAHGIETPEARRAAGKAELGQVVLAIGVGDNDITLALSDDGAGLDLAAVRRRAVARGLLDADAAISAEELTELIFLPGFSTAEQVSAVAGRGIGLDAVRDEVVQLGGRVGVSGERGRGARFDIVLPLALAVIPVMLVEAAGQQWAIPAALVEDVRELDAAEAAARQAAGGVMRNGQRYPWRTLPELFALDVPASPPRWQLLLKHAGAPLALAVSALTPNQEVVVKPLGAPLKRVAGLVGATVLPNGRVALIVNPLQVPARADPSHAAANDPGQRPPAADGTPKPGLFHVNVGAGETAAGQVYRTQFVAAAPAVAVMVVDDSLTVRKVTGRLLERAGYRVTTAKDGEDALDQLDALLRGGGLPDVMLADIEMPRLDGFGLVRALKDDARLAQLPVIMITSRIADKHRQLAESLGVAGYLGKPYDEVQLLDLIASLAASRKVGAGRTA